MFEPLGGSLNSCPFVWVRGSRFQAAGIRSRKEHQYNPVETQIEKLVAISFLVIGLSHIFQPRAWVRFFVMLREKGEVGGLLNGLLHFPLGAVIVAFHNVWHGIPLIVTIIGWGLVIKSSLYLFYPKHAQRMLATVKEERAYGFVIAGFFSVGLSGLIAYSLFYK